MSLLRSEEGSSVNRSHSSIEEDEEDSLDVSSTRSHALKEFKDSITVEPMMFLHMVALTCGSVILQNMYIDRICRLKIGFNDTICSNLSEKGNEPFEGEVDKIAANYGMYRDLIEAGFPVLFALFLGPWADKNGTKVTMLLPIVGYILSGAMYTTFSFFPDVHPKYLLLCSLPVALSGGIIALVLSAFTFMAKITTTENRSFRIAILEVIWFLGGPIGLTIGNAVFQKLGFPAVFILSTSLYSISFIYALIFVKESKIEHIEETIQKNKFTQLFNVDAVRDVFSTIFRPRLGSLRALILVLIFAMCLRIFTMFGASKLNYLYTRKQFQWNTTEYSTYATVDSLLQIFGGWIMTFLALKMFKVSDTKIGLISSVGYCAGAFVYAFASAPWMMYLATVVQMFCGLLTIVIRSIVSKCVGQEELGKVFTFITSGEALMPLVGNLVYTSIFRSTVDTFAGAFYLVSAGCNAIIFICFIWFDVVLRKNSLHDPLGEDST